MLKLYNILNRNQKRQIGHWIFVTRKEIKEDTLNIIWCTEPITAKCMFVAEKNTKRENFNRIWWLSLSNILRRFLSKFDFIFE